MESAPDFDRLVDLYYRGLYLFAYGLTHSEAEACDLTQQTFYIWGAKGHQLRDPSKAKSWLFRTLYREFLSLRRRMDRFPQVELSEVEAELPVVSPEIIDQMDSKQVLRALAEVEQRFRAPLALFYLEDQSYKEIAEALEIPVGTVMSRISRGKAQLQRILVADAAATEEKIIPLSAYLGKERHG